MKSLFAAAAAVALLAGCAGDVSAKDVNHAIVLDGESGGLAGIGPGCFYLTYADPAFPGTTERATLPLNLEPNTPQIIAAMTLQHPTVSFNFGGPNPGVCKQPGWAAAPTILLPSFP